MNPIVRAIRAFAVDAACVFAPQNLRWHALAIALTFVLVMSGCDEWIVTTFRNTDIQDVAYNAGRIGFWTPVFLPLGMLVLGALRRDDRLVGNGWRVAESEILAAAICAAFKVFTGRPGPHGSYGSDGEDISHVFRLGFLRGGVFWGWPSSHVMVAVAASVALMLLCRESRIVKWLALAYAVYIAVSVSITFHWFSDVVAGAIIGSVIGGVVGRSGAAPPFQRAPAPDR